MSISRRGCSVSRAWAPLGCVPAREEKPSWWHFAFFVLPWFFQGAGLLRARVFSLFAGSIFQRIFRRILDLGFGCCSRGGGWVRRAAPTAFEPPSFVDALLRLWPGVPGDGPGHHEGIASSLGGSCSGGAGCQASLFCDFKTGTCQQKLADGASLRIVGMDVSPRVER